MIKLNFNSLKADYLSYFITPTANQEMKSNYTNLMESLVYKDFSVIRLD